MRFLVGSWHLLIIFIRASEVWANTTIIRAGVLEVQGWIAHLKTTLASDTTPQQVLSARENEIASSLQNEQAG